MTKAIPEGFHTITPTLVVDGALEAIKLYEKAFGATQDYCMMMPDGSNKVMHASLQIGNSKIFLSDANAKSGCVANKSNFYLYVENVDLAAEKAKKAGLTEKMAVQDMFWGDRMGAFTDKFGNQWTLATHVRDVSDEEMKTGAKQMMSKAA